MTRVALFLAGLAGIFLAALAVGSATDLDERTLADDAHAADEGHAEAAPAGSRSRRTATGSSPSRKPSSPAARSATCSRSGPDGSVLRDYDVEHERRRT